MKHMDSFVFLQKFPSLLQTDCSTELPESILKGKMSVENGGNYAMGCGRETTQSTSTQETFFSHVVVILL